MGAALAVLTVPIQTKKNKDIVSFQEANPLKTDVNAADLLHVGLLRARPDRSATRTSSTAVVKTHLDASAHKCPCLYHYPLKFHKKPADARSPCRDPKDHAIKPAREDQR